MDQLQDKGRVDTLIRSLSRFSERVMLILSGDSEVLADAKKIGPALIFARLWQRTGIKDAIHRMLSDRAFEFDVERAIFLTVLHRLMVSGSDRFCERWRSDYVIDGVDKLDLHHLYRAMGFLGEELSDQKKASPFASRFIKDAIEEHIFFQRKDLFTELDLVFFDTPRSILRAKAAKARFDGKWVLRTNTKLPADQVALKYKQLWQVERIFRDVKSLLETRPIYHRHDRTIRGHVFCSFLAFVLRKELDECLKASGHRFEWADIKQDLKALQAVTIEENGKRLALRTECKGVCGKVF